MFTKEELFSAISRRNAEIKSYPNACAYVDDMQGELNALIVYARRHFSDYNDVAPQFNRFTTKKEAENIANDIELIKALVANSLYEE